MDDGINIRLAALESWRTMVEVSLGKNELTQNFINERFNKLDSELKELKSTAKRLNMTVWAAVITYGLKFVISGGLVGASVAGVLK